MMQKTVQPTWSWCSYDKDNWSSWSMIMVMMQTMTYRVQPGQAEKQLEPKRRLQGWSRLGRRQRRRWRRSSPRPSKKPSLFSSWSWCRRWRWWGWWRRWGCWGWCPSRMSIGAWRGQIRRRRQPEYLILFLIVTMSIFLLLITITMMAITSDLISVSSCWLARLVTRPRMFSPALSTVPSATWPMLSTFWTSGFQTQPRLSGQPAP